MSEREGQSKEGARIPFPPRNVRAETRAFGVQKKEKKRRERGSEARSEASFRAGEVEEDEARKEDAAVGLRSYRLV